MKKHLFFAALYGLLVLSSCDSPNPSGSSTASSPPGTPADTPTENSPVDTPGVIVPTPIPSNNPSPEPTPTPIEAAREYTLNAQRAYNPSAWVDGVIELKETVEVVIPAEMKPLSPAPNYGEAILWLDQLRCRYVCGEKNYRFAGCLDRHGNRRFVKEDQSLERVIEVRQRLRLHLQSSSHHTNSAISATLKRVK